MNMKDFFRKWFDVENNDVKIHMSHDDLDGYGCHVVDCIYGVNSTMLCHGNPGNTSDATAKLNAVIQNEIDKMSDTDTRNILITISDLSFTEDEIRRLLAIGSRVHIYLVDHHQTCPEYPEMENFGYLKDTTKCATMLLYVIALCVNPDIAFEANMPVIDAINCYDLGRWGNWMGLPYKDISLALKLNIVKQLLSNETQVSKGCISVGDFVEYLTKTMCMISDHEHGAFFEESEDLDIRLKIQEEIQWMQKECARYINTAKAFTLPGLETGLIIPDASRNFFVIAKELMEVTPNVPYVCSIYWRSMSISACTTRDDLNLGEYFAKYGGGGHPKAAGCPFTQVAFMMKHTESGSEAPAWLEEERH